MCIFDKETYVCGHHTCWQAGRQTYAEYVEDSWEAYLNGTDDRNVVEGTPDIGLNEGTKEW